MLRISYWILPIISGAVWLGMLLGMLIGWTVDEHHAHYSSMQPNQTVAYISDIGAVPKFKPMFIACCAIMCATLDLSFLADRWLRHSGRLTPNGSRGQKALAILAILFAIVGTAGLILLSIFDVAHHKSLHDAFLLCFLGGYVLSAIFICWEYQRLGFHNRHLRILSTSFWIKLAFVLVEIILAIAFVSLNFTNRTTSAAVIEWTIAFIFSFYVFSFVIDLWPAVRTRNQKHRYWRNSYQTPPDPADDSATSEAQNEARAAAASHGTAGEMQEANGSGYGGGLGRGMNGNYYDADRATRTPRANHFMNGHNKKSTTAGSGGSRELNGQVPPQPAYQPSRSYGHRQEVMDTM